MPRRRWCAQRCSTRHPEIAAALDPVFASLTRETLQQLNARIAVDGEDAGAVADRLSEIRTFPAVSAVARTRIRRPIAAILASLAQPGAVRMLVVGRGARRRSAAGFVTLAPNRLVSGTPDHAVARRPPAPGRAALAACGAMLARDRASPPPRRCACYLAAAIAGGLLLIVLAAAGQAATCSPPARRAVAGSRSAPGSGSLARLRRAGPHRRAAARRRRRWQQLVAAALVAAAFAALAEAGLFDALSWRANTRRGRMSSPPRSLRHIVLVAAAVGPGRADRRSARARRGAPRALQAPLFAVLNLLQTIPSIALFGLLIVPLSALASGGAGAGARSASAASARRRRSSR